MGAKIINRRPIANPTWSGRPMTQAERDAAYEEEDRMRAELEEHLEWGRQQQERLLARDRGRQANITDRALRYRANADPPDGPKVCAYCGSRRNVEVHHKDGDESNTSHSNLAWACRKCNTEIGIEHRNRGIGRRTHQYNPGAKTAAQWATAVSSIHGTGAMTPAEAAQLIHDTPAVRRTRFQKQLWVARKRIYGRSGRATSSASDEVPF